MGVDRQCGGCVGLESGAGRILQRIGGFLVWGLVVNILTHNVAFFYFDKSYLLYAYVSFVFDIIILGGTPNHHGSSIWGLHVVCGAHLKRGWQHLDLKNKK